MSLLQDAQPEVEPAASVSRGGSVLSSASFEKLYREAWPTVVDYLRFRIGPIDANDVAADVFTRAWQARDQFDPSRGTAQAWLWGIARNAATDRLRSPPQAAEELSDTMSVDTGLAERGERAVRMARVAEAVADLDGIDQDIVALRFGGGLTHREVAELVGLTEAAAATRLHRAIKRMRAQLERSGPR